MYSSEICRKHLADCGGLFLMGDGRTLISWALWKLSILDFSWVSEITVRIKQVWVTATEQAVKHISSLVID